MSPLPLRVTFSFSYVFSHSQLSLLFSPQPSVASSRASAIPRSPMRMSLLVLHAPSYSWVFREKGIGARLQGTLWLTRAVHPPPYLTLHSPGALQHVSLPKQSTKKTPRQTGTKNTYTDRYHRPSVGCCLGRLPGNTQNLETACKRRRKKKILFSNIWKEFLVTIVH